MLSETLSCVWWKCSKCIGGWMGANVVGIMGGKGVEPNNVPHDFQSLIKCKIMNFLHEP